VLDQAYNDRLGIAAALNLNVLERLNRNSMPISTCAGFNIGRSITQGMGERRCKLVSLQDQAVGIDGLSIFLREYETI
jgi:uncharacterized SAM-dependent methyltransferase